MIDKRRILRQSAWLCALAIGLLPGCGAGDDAPAAASSQQTFSWKLVTAWPKNYPGLGTAPEKFAQRVNDMSGGRLKITVYGGGELVPALEVFDAVSIGTVEMGHSAAYYWKGKAPALQYFSAVPFGMSAQEMSSWLHHGGGLELYKEVYRPFNIVPMVGGSTGVQMAGWFNKEINSLDDLKGLNIRIPGLAGEIFSRLGASPVTLPASELYTAMQTGVIDAVEWVGPYNDLALGLHEVASYYYYPGWQEPGTMLEFLVHQEDYDALPKDLRAILLAAARATGHDTLDEYTARNNAALNALLQQGVQLRRLPQSVLEGLRAASKTVLEELADSDPQVRKVHDAFWAYQKSVSNYHRITEQAFINTREWGSDRHGPGSRQSGQ